MDLLSRFRAAMPTPDRASGARVLRRPGYDATLAQTLARVEPMLAAEPVVWLSTVRPDGLPHLVPTWFWWDGDAVVVYSKPDAVKVRNLRANPRLMIALGRPEEDFSVGLIEAQATLEAGISDVTEAFFAKYAGQLADGGLDREAFRATFTQAIRIVPTRFLAWHGRGAAPSGAGRPAPVERRTPVEVPVRGIAVRGTMLPAWA
jgi:PPOX class probable F420-dependent enzyme